MRRIDPSKTCLASFLFCAVMVASSSAQTFSVITNFHGPNGASPEAELVQGLDGNFYGVTMGGGNHSCQGGCGTIFKVSPDGKLTTMHEFVGTDGFWPEGGLVLAADGNFYGTTAGGHPAGPPGAIFSFFKLTPGGNFSTVSSLLRSVSIGLIQDTANGIFYGIDSGQDTAFSLTTSGTQEVIYSFCPHDCVNIYGFNPEGPLLQDIGNGLLYGTASQGGLGSKQPYVCPLGCGTVFFMGTGGTIKALYQFTGTGVDGWSPSAGLVQADDGNFYGTTAIGGYGGSGTVFKITPTGTLTTLYYFCYALTNCVDGATPRAALIQATDGNFYGTTVAGGTGSTKFCNGCGTAFQLTPSGTLTSLHSFQAADGGVEPSSAMVQGTDGNLYGLAVATIPGDSSGAIYKISLGLAPFVKTLPLAAHKGTRIFILGTDLTGATSVTFNGTAAAFTVVSATEITATVPAGGTSGTVQVVTPGGTLSSNVPFRVY
jgi:uncharacterized repeat protein (TIGR03803 family)